MFGVLGGALGDRLGASRGFMFGSMLRFVTVFAAFTFASGPNTAWVVAFFYSAVSQLSTPAEMAMVRTISGRSSAPAHSLIVGLQYGGQALGMLALAPALYWLGGERGMLLGSAVGFCILTVMTAALSLRLGDGAPSAHPGREAFSLRETVRFFRHEALARDAATVLAVKTMVAQGIVVTLPLYMKDDIGLGRTATSLLLIPGIVGCGGGPHMDGANGDARPRRRDHAPRPAGHDRGRFALAALDLSMAAVADHSHVAPVAWLDNSMNTTYVVAFPVAFLIGLGLSGALVSARVALTESAPLGQQSRVFAVQSTLTDTLVVLPLLLLGVGAQLTGARTTLAAIGVLATIALISIEQPRFRVRRAVEAGLAAAAIPVRADTEP